MKSQNMDFTPLKTLRLYYHFGVYTKSGIYPKGANFTPSLDTPKFLWYNYTIADSMFTAIFNQVIISEDLNLQTFFHTLLKYFYLL